MKKILIIGLTERMGGVETFIYNTTLFSDKTRYKIDFLAHGTKAVLFEKEINAFYGDKNHFFFVEQFKTHPIKSFFQLYRFYKQHHYDIVHLQTGATFEIVYCFPFAIMQGAKIIVHSHNGCGFSKWINAVFRPLINFVVDKRLACSVHAASWLFGKKYIEKTLVVKNGIDVDKFVFHDCYRTELRKEYKIEDKFVVGHIGRFSEQKNHVFLLKIFEKILKKRPDSILFLVGDGELYNDVWKEISRKCLQDKIIHVKRTDKSYMFYCAFDCFCMPSLYEGLPIVGVEAQTAGLQCFFSKNISPEIELTDHCHLLSLNESPEHWADCILEVECSDDRRACAENVRLKGFDIRSTTAQIADIYETIK